LPEPDVIGLFYYPMYPSSSLIALLVLLIKPLKILADPFTEIADVLNFES
jgi:hypothetical protein